MSLPNSEGIFDKIKGVELDAKDRFRLDGALLFCAGVIVALLVWKPPVEPKVAELAMSNAWIAGMVVLFIYVAGVRIKRVVKPKVPTLGDTKS